MESNLHTIEFQLKDVVENAPFPIGVYTGLEMKVILANKAMINTWGKGEEVVGKSYFDLLPELQGQGIYEQLLHVLATGESFHAKNTRVDLTIDGITEIHYFNYAFTPLRDTLGNIYGVMNTAADVTDLNTARQQVVEAEEKLRLAIQSAEMGTYEINLLNDQVAISGNFRELWGIDEEVITKEMIVEKIHPDDRHLREAAFENIGLEGILTYQVRILQRGDAIRWMRVNGTIIKDSYERPVLLVGITQDITAQIEYQQQLAELVRERTVQLQRSNDDLLKFSHIVSHDLKEPIRKVKTFSQMLKSATQEEKRILYHEKIDSASNRMASMVDSILNYSSINSTGFPVEISNLNDILQAIKNDLELLIQEKKAIFIEDQLPSIEGSPILLQRLFYNLVNNALKFSQADQPPRVSITWVAVEKNYKDYIRISIEDNGIGIEPEYTEKIFNAFERLHSREKFEGSGLGLSLCRNIVQRHHGTIQATGKQDGAEFTIELPFEQPKDFV